MNTENEHESKSQQLNSSPKKRYVGEKNSRKKKTVAFIIVAVATAYGTLSYLNKSADPTSWEGIRTDYNNTK